MGKSPAEKLRKRKAAQEKKRAYFARRAKIGLFPEIRILEPVNAPQTLVIAVQEAAKEIRARHAELFDESTRVFFRDARQRGFGPAAEDAYAKARLLGTEEGFSPFCRRKAIGFGQLLYDHIPWEVPKDNILYHCIDVEFSRPEPNSILISFRSLLSAKTGGGTRYYSRRKPTLHMGGRERFVGFSRHAIEKIYERSVSDWRTFGGSGDAFALLDNCVYFEDCSAQCGEPCFTLYNACRPGLPYGDLPQLLLGEEEPGKAYYFRIGYCPVAIEGDLVKAITMKSPGMTKTPERVALGRARLSRPEKDRLNELAAKLEYRQLAEADDYRLIRWFHEHAVPQVVTFDHEVFRYD